MATIEARTTPDRAALIGAARERLAVLDHAGPVALFGAAAHAYTDGVDAQRIDVEDVTAAGGSAVALLVQRGRHADGTWFERRLSAVFRGSTAEPRLHGSWVAGLDAASRGW